MFTPQTNKYTINDKSGLNLDMDSIGESDIENAQTQSNSSNNIPPKRTKSLSNDIDRDVLVRYVENALCLNGDFGGNPLKRADSHISHRRSSLIPELKNDFNQMSILKDLKNYEIENNANIDKEKSMKQKINDELHDFDALVGLLSLMVEVTSKKSVKKNENVNKKENNNSDHADLGSNVIHCNSDSFGIGNSFETDKELLHYMKCIEDRELLTKITKLRKIIQYFFTANKYEKNACFQKDIYDDEDDGKKEEEMIKNDDDSDFMDNPNSNQNNIEQRIEINMNSFFRPFIFVESIEGLKHKISQQSNQSKKHHHNNNFMLSSPTQHRIGITTSNEIELTNRLLYHGSNVSLNQSVELMFFKLGYKPTFNSNIISLDTIISQDFFDIIIIDNDDIIQIEQTLKLLSKPKVKSAINLLFLVSNNMNYYALLKISKKYGVHIILRKPLIFQDLYTMFKDIGLLMFT